MLQLTARRRSLVITLAVLLPLGLSALAAAQELAEGDHRALAGYLRSYLATDSKQKEKDKAKEELLKGLDKIGKKRVEKGGDAMQAALALTADLGRVVGLASEYKNIPGGKATAQSFDVGDKKKQEYALWLPSAYKSATPMPLILCFPGIESGKIAPPAEFLQKHWIEKEVRDGALIAVVAMPESTATWGQPDGGIRVAMLTFKDVTDRFAIDRDRIYLLGRGEGVGAALTLAAMFPQRFAAVIGTAGDAGNVAPTNFQNLPTFFQGAGGDASTFEQKNKEAGYNNCTLNPAATVPEMWSWMQAHPRIANPAKVTLAPSSPNANKAYWITIPPTEGQGISITAEADRATNTVTIKGNGVLSVTVFLNDVLVDLSKPVKLVLNGREQQDVIPRSIDDFLELVERRTCDAGMIYVARKAYDLPE